MISEDALKVLFTDARTHSAWLAKDVPVELLHAAYNLTKMGPTSANTCPLRIVFVKSKAAKEKLKPFLDAGNVGKTMAAPVTAILAHDLTFYEKIPQLYPNAPQFADYFKGPANAEAAKLHAFRNGTLQAAYFILAARAVGLDCGPMSGFSNAKLDEAFFPDGKWKSNILVNLGYGDPAKLHARNPRLAFEEACVVE
jgi:3-hydroxypropanoate dehydrogenase